jgi:hypothetical protein
MQGIDLVAALPVILQTHPHRQGEQAGKAYPPLSCTAEALERFASVTFAVGVRLETDDRLPYRGSLRAGRSVRLEVAAQSLPKDGWFCSGLCGCATPLA